MKYKTMGIISIFLAFTAAFCGLYLTKHDEGSGRIHQHLQRQSYTPCEQHGEEGLCSHLPIIEINTGGVEIPGKMILKEDGDSLMTVKTSRGEDRIRAEISVFDHKKKNNHLSDEPKITSDALINIRGYSSRTFDKPGYAIKLITEEGENNPEKMLGMGSHHEWALHGPFLDKTLIRNYMIYNLSGEIMEWAPNVRFCEVVLNGEYRGLYLLTETISSGNDGSRLNISVNKKENSFTGYILKLDRGTEVPIKEIDPFSGYTYKTESAMEIVYPGYKNLNEQIRKEIELDFSRFEKALYSFDLKDDRYGYKNAVDVDSFVNYFLINELTSNYDAGIYSTFIYKDLGGQYKLAVWDFNNSADNYQEMAVDPHLFQLQYRPWFTMLMKDEDFVERIITRYRQLRKTTLSNDSLLNYIDETIAYLGPAIERNYEKWGYVFNEENDRLHPQDRNLHSYDEAVDQLKNYLIQRAEWMDENIDTLRQYCEKSKDKRFEINAN